jgi:DNA sulfur modification protein DndD
VVVSGTALEPKDLINRQCYQDGERKISVKMQLVDDDDNDIVIQRTWEYAPEGRGLLLNEEARQLKVVVAGKTLIRTQALKYIESVFPETLSKFFIFDGERLNTTVAQITGTMGSESIRNDIHSLLGTPILDNVIGGLETYRQYKLEPQIKRLTKGDKKLEQINEQVEALEKVIAKTTGDLQELQALKDRTTDDLKVSSVQIELFREKIQNQKKLKAYEKQITVENSKKDQALEELPQHISNLWRSTLTPAVNQIGEGLKEQAGLIQQYQTLKKDIDEIGQGLQRCARCNQELSAEYRDELLHEKNQELDALDPEPVGFNQKYFQIVGKFPEEPGYKRYSSLKRKVGNSLSEIRRNEKKIANEHLTELTPDDAKDVDRLIDTQRVMERELGRCESTIEKLNRSLEIERGNLKSKTSKRDVLLAEGSQSNDELQELNRLSILTRAISQCMESGRNTLGHQLRVAIEEETDEIFHAICTNKAYGKISIDEKYVIVVDWADKAAEETEEATRALSDGEKNVLAYSFVLALNEISCRNKPLFIDTPFGRLDPTHRNNSLRRMASQDFQISLFVQSGETGESRIEDIESSYEDVVRQATFACYEITRDIGSLVSDVRSQS